MNRILYCLVIAVIANSVPYSIIAQTAPIESLINAERSFAALSVASGTKAAFLANLAEQGIVFAPEPTNGKRVWEKRPSSKSVLAWEPEFSAISSAGDMGYNYGPWTWSSHKDTLPSRYGHFISVWKKQPDGTWKVALDLGIVYPTAFPKPLRVATVQHTTGTSKTNSPNARDMSLLSAEKIFAEASAKNGMVAAYQGVADENVALFRIDQHPMHGKNNITQALFEKNATVTWETLGSDVAESGDIGYTFGSYSFVTNGKTQIAGYYQRTWKKTADASWKLVVDVTNPLPQ